ncbi:MAG: molybdopterin molybdotransferase MoeA [Pseudomonadota bacterium]
MISVEQAGELIAAELPAYPVETIPLAQSSGRVLRQLVKAERDQPPFDRVTMDGIAYRYSDLARSFHLRGRVLAGDPPLALDDPEGCLEVMTGCVMPKGADTVVPVEQISVSDNQVTLNADCQPRPGQFIHRKASDHSKGSPLLEPGQIIGMPEMAVLASAGLATVEVSYQPSVSIVATGNELVAAGDPIAPHQIRLSNGPAIQTGLDRNGFGQHACHHLPDTPALLEERIGNLLSETDILILSGGVSMGKADFVPQVLNTLGVRQVFHKVTQRPGKPFWFGVSKEGKPVFALPGNPVSALVGFRRHILPAMFLSMGANPYPPELIALGAEQRFKPALTAFVAVSLSASANGMRANPKPNNTSGDFAALAKTDGFIELDRARELWQEGELVPFYRWNQA